MSECDRCATHATERPPGGRGEVVAMICDYSMEFVGGAQTAMLSECRSLVASGARVVLIVPGPDAPDMTAGLEVRTLRAPHLPFVRLPVFANSRRTRSALSSLLRREGATVVHVHSEFGLGVAALDVARELGLPSAITVHTYFWKGPRGWFARPAAALAAGVLAALTRRGVTRRGITRRGITRRGDSGRPSTGDPIGDVLRRLTANAAALAGVVISPSQHQAEALVAAGAENVRVVPNTVLDPPAPGPRAERSVIPVTGPLRLLWIGRCAPEKRLLPFVEASVIAVGRLPEGALRVDIVGDGPDLPRARRLSAGAAGIRFHGSVPNARVHELIRRSHLVALTSHGFDNQPMVVVEALREGRGVLYVDQCLTEGLDTAGILSPSDPSRLAESIIELCHERRVVVAAGAAAHEAFALFEPTRHAEAVLSAYSAARAQCSEDQAPRGRVGAVEFRTRVVHTLQGCVLLPVLGVSLLLRRVLEQSRQG